MLSVIVVVLFSFQIFAQEKTIFEFNDLEINVFDVQSKKKSRFDEDDFFKKYNDVQNYLSVQKVERGSLYYQIKNWVDGKGSLKVNEVRVVTANMEKRNYLIYTDKTYITAEAINSFTAPTNLQFLSSDEWCEILKSYLNNDARVIIFFSAELINLPPKKNKKIAYNNN